MPVIIGVNPVKRAPPKRKTSKRKPQTKKGANKMAKKRGRKKGSTSRGGVRYRTRTVTKYKYRNKPKKRAAYRVKRRESNDLDIKKIVRGSVSVAIGMVVAKAAVNKLTEGGSEQVRWTWPNIATAAASSMVAAFALGALFKLKKPTVGLIAAGGVSLAMYKAFTCKLAPKWGWSESWFGADEDVINPALLGQDNIHPDFLGYGAEPEIDVMEYEEVPEYGQLPGEMYGYGAATESGGQVVPYDPSMGAATESGGQVVPYNPAFGMAANYPGGY
jgi:hypothetical protein